MDSNTRLVNSIAAHVWMSNSKVCTKAQFDTIAKAMEVDVDFQEVDFSLLQKADEIPLNKKNIVRHLCLGLLAAKIRKGIKVTYTDGQKLYFPASSIGTLVSYYIRRGMGNSTADKWKNEIPFEQKWKGHVEYYVVTVRPRDIDFLDFFQEANPKSFVRKDKKKWDKIEDVILTEDGYIAMEHQGRTYLITDHVIDQWRARCTQVFGARRAEKLSSTPERIINAFKTILEDGVPLQRRNHLKQIIKNGFRLSRYVGWKGWVLVIEEGDIIKTIYYKGMSYEGYTPKEEE